MQQMNVPDKMKVNVDYDDKALPHAARTLQPLVFTEGDAFYCVLGPDMQKGVLGSGQTAKDALIDWEANVRRRIIYHNENDEVAEFIIDKLNARTDDSG